MLFELIRILDKPEKSRFPDCLQRYSAKLDLETYWGARTVPAIPAVHSRWPQSPAPGRVGLLDSEPGAAWRLLAAIPAERSPGVQRSRCTLKLARREDPPGLWRSGFGCTWSWLALVLPFVSQRGRLWPEEVNVQGTQWSAPEQCTPRGPGVDRVRGGACWGCNLCRRLRTAEGGSGS